MMPPMRFVSCGCDNKVKEWIFEEGERSFRELAVGEHSDWVRDVAWSPNVGLRHDLVASGGEDQKVTIWAKEQDQWSRRFVIEGTRVA